MKRPKKMKSYAAVGKYFLSVQEQFKNDNDLTYGDLLQQSEFGNGYMNPTVDPKEWLVHLNDDKYTLNVYMYNSYAPPLKGVYIGPKLLRSPSSWGSDNIQVSTKKLSQLTVHSYMIKESNSNRASYQECYPSKAGFQLYIELMDELSAFKKGERTRKTITTKLKKTGTAGKLEILAATINPEITFKHNTYQLIITNKKDTFQYEIPYSRVVDREFVADMVKMEKLLRWLSPMMDIEKMKRDDLPVKYSYRLRLNT